MNINIYCMNEIDEFHNKQEANGIMDYDFEDIDRTLLKTSEIKDKHIYTNNSEVKTSKTVLKNNKNKLS